MTAAPPRLSPGELEAAGRALFGPTWQTDLSRALGLSDPARVREWLGGRRRVPEGVRAELVKLLRARSAMALMVADAIEAGG